MPWAHTLRRWLWRANAVLVLGVLAVWIVAVTDEPGDRPHLRTPEPQPAVAAEPLGPDIPHEEMVALARAFHGWGEAVARAEPVAEAPPDDRLPLRAFEVRMWYRDPAGPDAILLLSKDPASSERFLPREGQPDQVLHMDEVHGPYWRTKVSRASSERPVALALATKWMAPTCAVLSGLGLALSLVWPEAPFLKVLVLGPAIAVVLILFLCHFPDGKWVFRRFPGSRWMLSLAGALLLNSTLAAHLLGGEPSRRIEAGACIYAAFNHGQETRLTALEYYWLVASLPAVLGAILVQCLLAHRWSMTQGRRHSGRARTTNEQ